MKWNASDGNGAIDLTISKNSIDDVYSRHRTLRKAYPRLGSSDLKIAAISIAHDATLLTRNTRDFSQIQNLRMEDWSI
jgi:predicted nucleic acid-binding protein